MLPACTGYLHKQSFIIRSLFEFFSFTLLLFRSLFRSLVFVRLSHSLINTVLLCIVSMHHCSGSLWRDAGSLTEQLLSQSFVRFCDEDDVLPTAGGELEAATTTLSSSSLSSSPCSSSSSVQSSSCTPVDSDSVVDVCTVSCRLFRGTFDAPVLYG